MVSVLTELRAMVEVEEKDLDCFKPKLQQALSESVTKMNEFCD